MEIGYAREIGGLTAGKQVEELQAAGCDMVVREGIAALLRALGDGDRVVVCTLGALGKTPKSAVRAALEIAAKAADLKVLDQGIDTSEEEHRLFFQHAAAVMRVGHSPSRTKAPHRGGKPKTDANRLARAVGMYESGEYRVKEILEATGISKTTLYRNVRKPGSGDT